MEAESAEYTTDTLTGKLHELLSDSENDASQFSFEEETIEEVMQEFYNEIIACPKQPSSPTITAQLPKMEEIPLPVVELCHDNENISECAGFEVVQECKMEEREEDELGDFDDEWLARVLNWGQGKVGDIDHWFRI